MSVASPPRHDAHALLPSWLALARPRDLLAVVELQLPRVVREMGDGGGGDAPQHVVRDHSAGGLLFK